MLEIMLIGLPITTLGDLNPFSKLDCFPALYMADKHPQHIQLP